jgi:GDP-L-fucose synthase
MFKLEKNSRIFLSGHNGMLGTALNKHLIKNGYTNIEKMSRKNLDLTNQNEVFKYLKNKKPEVIIICAGKVGGINANISYPYDFFDGKSNDTI